MLVTSISPFPAVASTSFLTLSQTTNFGLFQTESLFADDNLRFDENGGKFSKS